MVRKERERERTLVFYYGDRLAAYLGSHCLHMKNWRTEIIRQVSVMESPDQFNPLIHVSFISSCMAYSESAAIYCPQLGELVG